MPDKLVFQAEEIRPYSALLTRVNYDDVQALRIMADGAVMCLYVQGDCDVFAPYVELRYMPVINLTNGPWLQCVNSKK